jgi:hypothetical protein
MPTAEPSRPTWQDLIHRAQSILEGAERRPVTHHNGIAFNELVKPRRWHRCWAQSQGACGPFELVERCPCGAIRIDGPHSPWLGRNGRRYEQFGLGPGVGGENVGDDGPDVLLELRTALREGPTP